MTRGILLSALVALAACAAIPAEEKVLLTEEIDCAKAEETIAAIREARPTDLDRARVLAMTLTPGGFALGLATDDLDDRKRLMSGAYDEALDARLHEIARACDTPVPELD